MLDFFLNSNSFSYLFQPKTIHSPFQKTAITMKKKNQQFLYILNLFLCFFFSQHICFEFGIHIYLQKWSCIMYILHDNSIFHSYYLNIIVGLNRYFFIYVFLFSLTSILWILNLCTLYVFLQEKKTRPNKLDESFLFFFYRF